MRKPELHARRHAEAGFTLVEMVVTCAVMVILAGVVFPTARVTERRMKEAELKAALREMRYAIDDYKRYSDSGMIPVDLDTQGYPRDLDKLVDGVDIVGQVDKKVKFLRRIPIDPMTGEAEWGLRSYQDEAESQSWGGGNVYDVYSLSGGTGIDGVPYAKW
ncbi:MAG TPA: prepilin-type N-terminal cleavage/methylation domain-containing protein [Thermoanaerobaculia bacterium]|nr:prepilin-type N-terminal cleavage/methylation domain-containing protein [Thermoanaerobaculia bacterium]